MTNIPTDNIRTLVSIGENGFYKVEIEGAGSARDLARIISEVALFPDSVHELWITRNLKLDASNVELVALADLAKELPHRPEKVAIVASDDLMYGLGRIYAGHRESDEHQLNVFRDEESALQWLQPELDPASLERANNGEWRYHKTSATGY